MRGNSLALYPDPPMKRFEIVFVDDLGDGTYEVGVRLIFELGSYGETLFVHRDGGDFRCLEAVGIEAHRRSAARWSEGEMEIGNDNRGAGCGVHESHPRSDGGADVS